MSDAPTIEIRDENGRTLLTLDRRGGQLVAEYDAADLDEAARIFVREVLRIARTEEHT